MILIPTNSLRRLLCTVISVNVNVCFFEHSIMIYNCVLKSADFFFIIFWQIMLVALETKVINLPAVQKGVGFAVGDA